MTETQLEDHGDATLNAAGACLPNPVADALAAQRDAALAIYQLPVVLMQASVIGFWKAVLK